MISKKDKYEICIIGGLGHVGLPLGIYFSDKGVKVCCYDINESLMGKVKNGQMPYIEKDSNSLLKKNIKNKNLSFSSDPKSITISKQIIIAIGTPVDQFQNPQISNFLKTIDYLKPYFKNTQLIIVRSSVYPRICKKINNILGENLDIDLAYCPERIVQGAAFEELGKLPQVISGFSDTAIKRASSLFKLITNKIVYATVEEAELMKLFSNSWRYIQFAVANQFFMIANDYGEDFNKIRKIMIKDYDRAKEIPSAGFTAGPCLLKDTMQLSFFSNNNFFLGQAAMNINEGLPSYIINNLKLNNNLNGINIGIIGMAFKADIDDSRDSLSYKLKKILLFEGANVFCSDPYVNDERLIDLEILIARCSIIIVGAPHKCYKNLKISGKEIVDIWNILDN